MVGPNENVIDIPLGVKETTVSAISDVSDQTEGKFFNQKVPRVSRVATVH